MERGDPGPGRDARGRPGRRRWGDRRAYGLKDDAEGAGAGRVDGPDSAADDDYGQLLRRPGEPSADQQRARQPDRPHPPQPGRFPPPPGHPASGHPPNGFPPDGLPANGHAPNGNPRNSGPVSGGPVSGGPAGGGPLGGDPVNGGPRPDRQYRLPYDRRIPPDADRPHRAQAPGPADGNPSRPGPAQAPGRIPGQDRLGGIPGRPGRPPQAPGAPPPGVPGGQQARAGRGVRGVPAPPEPAGPVIRQRKAAVPDEPPPGTTPSVASIAPDGIESFARDLRALRAGAGLDYPELAELSHYTMKTLAAAAAGLQLPTLPVAVAYVRACGGNVADWEERWQKLAAKITADTTKKRLSDGDDHQTSPEPADPAASQEPPAVTTAATDPDPDPGEIYVITSAKPRQPGWPGAPRGRWGPGGTEGG